ncbi:hypothetical protein BJY00DRAFT_308370 [Aspergillus carlsbadensis]|nr:hypothetical protein BJY00DRAFT_308370 [Aspergillus carlsbadensis]
MNDVSDRLLHTELRAIIAATTHGLAQEPLKRHMIIPVMVFSVFGEQHGRILTAYFDGGYLVIHKSNIHRFSGTNRDPFNLFLRYMAADINEQEDTTKYTLKKAQIVDKPG